MPGSYSSTPGRRVPSIQIFMLPVAYSTTCLPWCTLPSNSTAIFNYIALFLFALTILSFPLSKCFLLLPSAPLFIACLLFVYLFHFVSLFPSSSLPFFLRPPSTFFLSFRGFFIFLSFVIYFSVYFILSLYISLRFILFHSLFLYNSLSLSLSNSLFTALSLSPSVDTAPTRVITLPLLILADVSTGSVPDVFVWFVSSTEETSKASRLPICIRVHKVMNGAVLTSPAFCFSYNDDIG